VATSKASSDPVAEQGMAEGLRILARIIATAHKRRLRDTERAKGQYAGSTNVHQCKESKRKQLPPEAKTERRRD
jgi:hypothetical protein